MPDLLTALAAIPPLPDAPRVLDRRDPVDAAADPRSIPNAQAATLAALERGAPPVGPVVCTCRTGAMPGPLAAIQRDRGVAARALRGGHVAWLAAGRIAARRAMAPDPRRDGLPPLSILRRLVDREATALPVENDWLAAAAAAATSPAEAVPATPRAMAGRAGLSHPAVEGASGGPEALPVGRLARVASPEDALDRTDDWLAGTGRAA